MKWFVFPKKATKAGSLLFGLEVGGVIASVWLMVYPQPYMVVFSLVLCIPIIRLLLYLFHKNKLTNILPIDKSNDYSDITDFIDITTIALAYRVLMDISITNNGLKNIVLYSIIFFIIFTTCFFWTLGIIKKPIKNPVIAYTMILINIAIYSYSGVCAANSLYAQKNIAIHQSLITKKWVGGRAHKIGTPYLQLGAWTHEPYGKSISVSDKCYRATNVGDTVLIYAHKGLFNVDWYELEEKFSH